MFPPAILVTDSVHPLLLEGFARAGFACDYRPDISHEEVLEIIPNYIGLIINSKILVKSPLLQRAERLRFVGRLGSGMEIVDLAEAQRRGVRVFSSPSGNCDAVAEHALGMLLAWAINLRRADAQVRRFDWQREQNRGWELMGKTIGIIGVGHTGGALLRRLEGWGMRALCHDKYKPSGYAGGRTYAEETDMEAIWAEADIVSLHLPLTAENQHLVNKDWLARFRKPIVLVNTSRGQVVQTEALLEALRGGQVRGACLDVFENEKPATYTPDEQALYAELFAMPQVLVTPHIAGWTHESKARLAQLLLDAILAEFASLAS